MRLDDRCAPCVCGRWLEPWPGAAPEYQVLTPNEAGRDCDVERIPWKSRHSLRNVPISLSQNAFAFGVRTGVLSLGRQAACGGRGFRR